MIADLTARIRARAYELWAADGRPEGTQVGYWLKAERELKAAKEANNEAAKSQQQVDPKDVSLSNKLSGL